MKLRILFILVALLAGMQLVGQKALKKADKQFDLQAYDLAITNYLKVLNDDPTNLESKIKLAEAFRLTNQYLSALQWYNKAVEQAGDLPKDNMINYAHTLKSVGLYDKAQMWYWKYKMHDPVEGEHFALSCDYAKNLLEDEDKYEISLCRYNTSASDFGVTFFENKMVLSSFRVDMMSEDEMHTFNEKENVGNRLFIEGSSPDKIQLLRKPMKNAYGIGPLHYSRDGKLVAYTKNDFQDGGKHVVGNEKDMSIYFAIADDTGDFDNAIPFPYNDTEYSCAFPMLSYNGTELYFASNMPGGEGGFDVYVSRLENGNWTKPENLGANVNTPGNEITPFFDGDELFFSSDYIQGLGGYDVFRTRVVNGEWSYAENMGKGVNSPSDDYYFSLNLESGEMFFSSNRLGGRGSDDIYIASEVEIIEYVFSQPVDEENLFVPRAVSLEDLKPVKIANQQDIAAEEIETEVQEMEGQEAEVSEAIIKKVVEDTGEAVAVANDATTVTVIRRAAPEVAATTSANLSLIGARKISVGEVVDVNSRVYFIQLAALSSSRGTVEPFRALTSYGNLYKAYKRNSTKIKLGYYLDRSEAKDVLQKVKSAGYYDAFITYDELSSADMEMVASSNDFSDSASNSASSTELFGGKSRYKVRLAAYTDPLWFDIDKVKDLGNVEQWTKGEWTIFILSGYGGIDEAQRAKVQAMQRGFQEAELVIDNNGILEKLQQN